MRRGAKSHFGCGKVAPTRSTSLLHVNVENAVISTNIFEEGGGQSGEPILDVKDDEQDASHASPDAHLDELSRIRYDRRREQLGGGM